MVKDPHNRSIRTAQLKAKPIIEEWNLLNNKSFYAFDSRKDMT